MIAGLDFIILTVPRSGSHMLASALDSHPDICCIGEVGKRPLYDWLGTSGGEIKGGIVDVPCRWQITPEHKVICLTRDPAEIARSKHSRLSNGLFLPNCEDWRGS